MVPLVGKITVYPLKSFDGIDLEFSDVLASGALEHDRQLGTEICYQGHVMSN